MSFALKPCHVHSENFSVEEKKIHCGLCKKNIVDFKNKSPEEITKTLKTELKKGNSVCGQFNTTQINHTVLEIPTTIFNHNLNWYKTFALAFIMAFGVTSCTIKSDTYRSKIKKVTVSDSVRVAPQFQTKSCDSKDSTETQTIHLNGRPMLPPPEIEMTGDVVVLPEIEGEIVEPIEPIAGDIEPYEPIREDSIEVLKPIIDGEIEYIEGKIEVTDIVVEKNEYGTTTQTFTTGVPIETKVFENSTHSEMTGCITIIKEEPNIQEIIISPKKSSNIENITINNSNLKPKKK